MIVVCDTQVLIGLAKGGVFDLLFEGFDEVAVPPGVWQEIVVAGQGRPGGPEVERAAAAGWLRVHRVVNSATFLHQHGLTPTDGEVAELARGLQPDFVLVDDRDVRRAVQSFGLAVLGTAATVLSFKQAGLIQSCRPVLDLMQHNGFGIDALINAQILGSAGE